MADTCNVVVTCMNTLETKKDKTDSEKQKMRSDPMKAKIISYVLVASFTLPASISTG